MGNLNGLRKERGEVVGCGTVLLIGLLIYTRRMSTALSHVNQLSLEKLSHPAPWPAAGAVFGLDGFKVVKNVNAGHAGRHVLKTCAEPKPWCYPPGPTSFL